MITLRYDEAASAAIAAEAQSGVQLLVLRPMDEEAAPGHPPAAGALHAGRGERHGADAAAAPAAGGGAGRVRGAVDGARNGAGRTDDVVALLGADRVRTAVAAAADLVAAAAGAALCGVRAVVELAAGVAPDEPSWSLDSVVAELAAATALIRADSAPGSNAATTAGAGGGGTGTGSPGGVVIRLRTGAGGHDHPGPWPGALATLLDAPGVTLAAPATPADCFGLVRAALRAPAHVVVLEAASLAGRSEDVPGDALALPLGRAEVVRPGTSLTIVAARSMRQVALEAAQVLARRGVEAEVIDPRCLSPFDDAAVVASLLRTARLLVVQDEPLATSWAAGLIARLASGHLSVFDAPPRLVGGAGAGTDAAPAPTPDAVAVAAADLVAY